jgi:Tol biopolymer transport system component
VAGVEGPEGVRFSTNLVTDGSRIAFYESGISVVKSGGGRPRRLTRSGEFEYDPAWSPDGRRIAFVRGGDGD